MSEPIVQEHIVAAAVLKTWINPLAVNQFKRGAALKLTTLDGLHVDIELLHERDGLWISVTRNRQRLLHQPLQFGPTKLGSIPTAAE